jgi:predicted permease
VLNDLRYAVRGFTAHPGFTLAAVLSLAIGIGANAALFSVTSALLLRPLAYKDAGRLVILWQRSPGLNIAEDWFSTAQYFDIKNGHTGFDQVAIAIGGNYALTGRGDPERIGVIRASSNLLPMLGAQPALGRLFIPTEDAPGPECAAVLGHGTWARRYGLDPQVVGASITLNGQPCRIVGVLREHFSLPREVLPTLGVAEDGDVFLSLPLAPAAVELRYHEDYNVIGALKPGVTVAAAQAEMDLITARLRREHPQEYPPNGGLTFSIVPLLEQVVGNVRTTLGILVAAVGIVLLIACTNVANLLLSRALARQREIAVRAAMGASRFRIVRQLLTESVLLALLGGVPGVVLAAVSVRAIQLLQPPGIPRLHDIAVNGQVLAFTLVLCVTSGVLFGLAPALGVGGVNLIGTLKEAGRGSAGTSRGNRLRRTLVAAELALSVVVLVGAGLLVRSFGQLQRVAPGFDPRGVLTLELTMTGAKYRDIGAVRRTYQALWERLDRLPGVTASGGVTSLPLSGFFAWGPIIVEGRAPLPGENFINADQRVVSGRYFETMGIPLVRGRLFSDQDLPDYPRVVIVDEYMAAELWPNADPIGKRIRLGDARSTGPWQTVVGVVGRVKQYGLDAGGRIALYLPHTQSPARALYVVLRAAGDPASVAAAASKEIHAIDPDLPVYRVRSMTAWVEQSLARQRFSMLLLSMFAGVALVLATIGVYGVMAYLVSQTAREIGIRIALGATQRAVVGMILRQGLTVSLAGTAVGLAGAVALTRFMQGLLFGVRGGDPATFGAVFVGLTAVALGACYLPARRAARIDATISLRAD